MPIIAIGVVNKQGKIILSRQFSDVSRSRAEGLLSSFPRLLEATKSASRQATYLDAGTTRYVYMPLDEMNNLYLTLLNDRKTSNIVEDLATLNLVGRIIPEYLRGGAHRGGGGGGDGGMSNMGAPEEDDYDDYDFMYDLEVMFAEVAGDDAYYDDGAASNDGGNETLATKSASMEEQLGRLSLDIFFALDEIVMEGKRDQVTLEQVQTYLEMDSHAERIYMEEKRKREEEAKRISSQHAKTIADQRRRHMLPQGGSYGGIGSDDFNRGGGGNYMSSNYNNNNNNNSYNMPSAPAASSYNNNNNNANNATQAAAPRTGMSLGKASLNKKNDIMSKVQQEMGVLTPPPAAAATAAAVNAFDPRAQQQQQQQQQKAIMVAVEEKMSCHIRKEGDASPVDVKGELSLLVNDPATTKLKIALQNHLSPCFQFKCHAKMNKNLFAENQVLSMAENKPFPVQQPITIMRWKLDASHPQNHVTAPIAFTCWPEEDSKSITIEYELSDNNNNNKSLDNVMLLIPLHHFFRGSGSEDLTVTPSCGEYDIIAPNPNDSQFKCVRWHIPLVTPHMNKEGNIEIQLEDHSGGNNTNNNNEELYFPIQVQFSSTVSLGQVDVREVVNSENGKAVEFGVSTALTAEHFEIS